MRSILISSEFVWRKYTDKKYHQLRTIYRYNIKFSGWTYIFVRALSFIMLLGTYLNNWAISVEFNTPRDDILIVWETSILFLLIWKYLNIKKYVILQIFFILVEIGCFNMMTYWLLMHSMSRNNNYATGMHLHIIFYDIVVTNELVYQSQCKAS